MAVADADGLVPHGDEHRRSAMAKGQKRSNREPKKPKAERKKEAPPASPFATAQVRPAQSSKGAKK
jgi:hypothetical protein